MKIRLMNGRIYFVFDSEDEAAAYLDTLDNHEDFRFACFGNFYNALTALD